MLMFEDEFNRDRHVFEVDNILVGLGGGEFSAVFFFSSLRHVLALFSSYCRNSPFALVVGISNG